MLNFHLCHKLHHTPESWSFPHIKAGFGSKEKTHLGSKSKIMTNTNLADSQSHNNEERTQDSASIALAWRRTNLVSFGFLSSGKGQLEDVSNYLQKDSPNNPLRNATFWKNQSATNATPSFGRAAHRSAIGRSKALWGAQVISYCIFVQQVCSRLYHRRSCQFFCSVAYHRVCHFMAKNHLHWDFSWLRVTYI